LATNSYGGCAALARRRPTLAVHALAGLVAAGALAACPGAHHDPPPEPLTTSEAVLELAKGYLATAPELVSIEARATQYSERGGLKGKLSIVLKRPGRFRIEGLSPTDDVVSVVATDAERFTAFQRGASTCSVGRACPANVGLFASIPLASDELVGVLLGRPPVLPHKQAQMKWDTRVGAYRLELEGDGVDLGMAHGRTQRLWVAHGDGRIVRTALLDGTKTKVDVSYSEWKKVGDRLMPGRLDIRLARDSTDLRLEYRDVDLSPEVANDAFTFTCPEGTTLEELPCGE
jgi:outer membrane lipoprotein-sorting protein